MRDSSIDVVLSKVEALLVENQDFSASEKERILTELPNKSERELTGFLQVLLRAKKRTHELSKRARVN